MYNTKGQWINAQFGDKWEEHALENYTPEIIAGIAKKNGRKAIMQEALLKQLGYVEHEQCKGDGCDSCKHLGLVHQ